eukprot:CAMPEP_0113626200 /NCGR_PEP_ID=MMETSP0017_2-20120614/13549_1 /TAXON_ID=2856 /ORGANISM="Cylindrotheca closterium" /LENGTH=380 /DNA_ID=CAMNT_0000536371 /DNA_START=478 /DNA_END=1617 /DNA_ORIENTATION=- /assembly_acc=CAM_ASM_000147
MMDDNEWDYLVIMDKDEWNNKSGNYRRDLDKACKERDPSFSLLEQRKMDNQSLAAGDYFLAARNQRTQKMYVLMAIERKTCTDLHRSFTEKCTTYPRLQRIDVQLRKLYSVGDDVIKLLLLEGHENTCKWYGKGNRQIPKEQAKPKIKGVKTFRKRFQNDAYYPGMKFVQTRDSNHTIDFICDQLGAIKRLFQNGHQQQTIVRRTPSYPQGIRANVNWAMGKPIFKRYLELVQEVSDGRAMKTIKDEYPRAVDFICPRHRYHGEHATKDRRLGQRFQCTEIDSPAHMPTFYTRQDSPLFAAMPRPFVARAAGAPTVLVEPTTILKRPYQRRDESSRKPCTTDNKGHAVIVLVDSEDLEETKVPTKRAKRSTSSCEEGSSW